MQQVKILLADDHTLVAHALASCLPEEFTLVGIVDDGAKLVDAAKELQPDVILSDISMPELSGIDALRALRKQQINTKFVFLTMHADPEMASEALRAGASGFLPKNSAGEELATALRAVMQGNVYLSPLIAGKIIDSLGSSTHRNGEKITSRQRDVLRLIAEGLSVKQIAAELDLSPRTVETHKYEMMQSLGVQSIAGLVRYAVRSGVVSQ
jgi:DNA-binding NarL/FixJ family response regulator